jgi:hypothetical protein
MRIQANKEPRPQLEPGEISETQLSGIEGEISKDVEGEVDIGIT